MTVQRHYNIHSLFNIACVLQNYASAAMPITTNEGPKQQTLVLANLKGRLVVAITRTGINAREAFRRFVKLLPLLLVWNNSNNTRISCRGRGESGSEIISCVLLIRGICNSD